MPPLALALIAFGGVWLCIWRRPRRLAGFLFVVPGLVLMLTHRSPDILIDGDGRLMATRDESGEIWLSSLRRAQFAGDTWLRRAGQEESSEWPWRDGAPAPQGLRCDTLGCFQEIAGQRVAFVRDARALSEDCAEANLVISLVPIRQACAAPHTVIDRFVLLTWSRAIPFDTKHAVFLRI